jgi:hypothetical protein
MGYAGLKVDELARLLAQHRIEAEPIEDDRWGDHCVVRLTDMRYPHGLALLYYENMGIEPRIARCVFGEMAVEADESVGKRISALEDAEVTASLELVGQRDDEPERIASWLADVLQSQRTTAECERGPATWRERRSRKSRECGTIFHRRS